MIAFKPYITSTWSGPEVYEHHMQLVVCSIAVPTATCPDDASDFRSPTGGHGHGA
ncbi:MAG TPA: hypothetical protein VMW71_02410 [Thermoplasmata archaeon]|nr:hypothetical protein [Thermoplasmata archaeon]